jgi:uncharacterized delta-60 repeat protein
VEEDDMLARFPRRPILTLVGAVALVIAIANPAASPPSDLDSTFDGDGKVTTAFDGDSDRAFAVAIQGDGKIVAAGEALVGNFDFDFALARYNADGTLDTTFDIDGRVTAAFFVDPGGIDRAQAVAIQGDGKIVAAGFADNFIFALARYNADGSLDTTFDTDGLVTTGFGGIPAQAFGVAIQGDGKIVATGYANDGDDSVFALVRYNTDGSLDPTFDGDGRVTTDVAGSVDKASAVAIQGDGKIVVAGSSLARYNTNGSLDTTFDGDGLVTRGFAGASAMAIQGDGKIVVAGGPTLARYNTNGSLDTTFGGDGKVTTDLAEGGGGATMAIQGDGKIVTAGLSAADFSEVSDFALIRYKPDGSLDTTFDGDGLVTTDFAGGFDQALGVAIQGDGKIVAAGCAFCHSSWPPPPTAAVDFALARYNTDGSLDPTFDVDGLVTTDFGGGPPSCAGRPATIIGTQAADTITGTPQNDVIVGLEGKDSIRAGGGSDIVCAGSGNDNVAGGRGKDRLRGERGNDRLRGGSGADRLIGGVGRDRLMGGSGDDFLLGGPGKDSQQQ